MKVSIRLFAMYRERAGSDRLPLELDAKATVGDALELLASTFPKLSLDKAHILVAVNREYVDFASSLKDGDELAIIPPVSGGRR